jgi:hypothetical protein
LDSTIIIPFGLVDVEIITGYCGLLPTVDGESTFDISITSLSTVYVALI